MKQTTLITNGKVVTPDRIVAAGEVYIKNGLIEYVGKQGERRRPAADIIIDADGQYILPGFVDMHSDAIEKEIEPRPGAFVETELAFRELEKKVAGHGITTMYHSFSFAGAEWGIRDDKEAANAIRTIVRMAESSALIHNKIHLRFEISDNSGVGLAKSLLEQKFVDLLSFMDHTPGQGQYPTFEDYRNYMEKTYHWPREQIEKVLEMKKRGGLCAEENIRTLSEAALGQSVPMASHDDDNPLKVAFYKEQGVNINEFPINLKTVAAAFQAGNYVCVGAPNILRGGSSGKGLRAIEAVDAGLVKIICSDYYPPAMLHSVFKLAEKTMSLPEAVAMVAGMPAKALHLNAGSLEEGKCGDVIIVGLNRHLPVVIKTIVAGVPVYRINYRAPENVLKNAEEQLA